LQIANCKSQIPQLFWAWLTAYRYLITVYWPQETPVFTAAWGTHGPEEGSPSRLANCRSRRQALDKLSRSNEGRRGRLLNYRTNGWI